MVTEQVLDGGSIAVTYNPAPTAVDNEVVALTDVSIPSGA
jgi:hypothetical protein